MKNSQAYLEGREAVFAGRKPLNPFDFGTEPFNDWFDGYFDSLGESIHSLSTTQPTLDKIVKDEANLALSDIKKIRRM